MISRREYGAAREAERRWARKAKAETKDPMIYILEVYTPAGDDSETRPFQTLRGAVAAGALAVKRVHGLETYGYLRAYRCEGDERFYRHVVAEWKDRGKLLARVWH